MPTTQSQVTKFTVDLVTLYARCNPAFAYSTQSNPRRILTKPSERRGNDGVDNENCDFILRVHDRLQADTLESCVSSLIFRVVSLLCLM